MLDLLVTWLSDPDNLNQLVVSQLDEVAFKRSVDDLCESEREDRASSPETEDAGAYVTSPAYLYSVVAKGNHYDHTFCVF